MSKRNLYFSVVYALKNLRAPRKGLKTIELPVYMLPCAYVHRCVAYTHMQYTCTQSLHR